MTAPTEGGTSEVSRTFTPEDVRRFAELSGDDQDRHLLPDEEGRHLVQGLLTATLPTEIGGDNDVLARRMDFEFVRPVYTGETITCRMTTESVTEHEDRYEFESTAVCRNEADEMVLRAEISGLIWKDPDAGV